MGTGDAVGGEALLFLELLDGGLGLGAVNAVNGTGVKSPVFEALLDGLDLASGGADLGEGVHRGGGECRGEDRHDQQVQKDDNGGLPKQAGAFFHCDHPFIGREFPDISRVSGRLKKM